MGEVIPFRRDAPPKEAWTYDTDLDAMLAITARRHYSSIMLLLTGVLLHILHDKNRGDTQASLLDVKEFVRGLRQEIKR